MSDFIAISVAHEPIVAALRDAGAAPGALRDIGGLLERHVRVATDGTATIVEADGTAALDRDAGYRPHTPESWVASLRRSRPHIFDVTVKPNPPAAPESNNQTLSELFLAANRGDPEALAELSRRARSENSSSTENKPNLSQLMFRARQGNAAAQGTLDNMYTRKN